jgi:diguanylate cyclase (GGDEF)-like protein
MIDLDHFKKFNDEHGHEVGDYILSEFGRLVRLAIRGEDIACRYGGEEFTIVLPEAERKGSLAVAEKIATMIREHDFLVNNRSCGPITVSIGVALFPRHGMTAEELFKQADDALYQAKREGRNRVVLAGGAD